MAQLQWTAGVAVPRSAAARRLQRLAGRFLDWEDWLTLGLALGATAGVSLSLEGSGWSSDMPALTLVGTLALLCALFLARAPLPVLLAWPLAAVTGAAVVFWQTLEMVGPGDLETKVDAIYFRFQTWFQLATGGGISNDPLPFNVMVVGVTWAGVFLFGWGIYRWHNAWPGLILGGVALFMNLAFIDDSLPFAVFLYVLFGFLLVMRTNLMARMAQWRAQDVSYPPLISLSFLHFTLWAGLFLLSAAWIAPVGPFPTPGPMAALAERFEGIGVHFVRLAGPLRAKKIVPVHDYTAVLPFQGSVELGERELLSVRVADPTVEGPLVLRGAVYDEYASGGWKAGPREEFDVPSLLGGLDSLRRGASSGRIVPVTVTVEAKTVMGSVLFTPGQPLSSGVPARAKLPRSSLMAVPVTVLEGDAGAALSDEEVLELVPPAWLGLEVRRDDRGRVQLVVGVPAAQPPDILVLSPREKIDKGESYSVLGVVREVSPDDLRRASRVYPASVTASYLGLPGMPARVAQLARDVAGSAPSAYDRTKAIESFLRGYPVDYRIGDTPPGRDAVDYFLFDARRGYFDYHASAMVVLLRSLGIPSRLAVGFVIDRPDFDEDAAAYVVRDRDAYAWVEVYFPGRGWIEFNPSPDRPADLRPGQSGGDLLVPPVDLEDLRDLPVGTGGLLPFDAGELAGAPGGPSSGGSGPGYAPWIALGVAGFLAAVTASAALGWRRSVAGLPYPQQVWEKTVRLASWAGRPPQPGQTPSGFARALERRAHVRDLDLLAAAYNRSRFGRKDTDAEERLRLARLWRQLRGPLAREVVRRLWRRS